jgi:response regulator of citrate/malate metabolism
MIGQMDFGKLLNYVDVIHIDNPVYLEADFSIDDKTSEASISRTSCARFIKYWAKTRGSPLNSS